MIKAMQAYIHLHCAYSQQTKIGFKVWKGGGERMEKGGHCIVLFSK